MKCLSRKWLWIGGASFLMFIAIIASLSPVRIQYHKWLLETARIRKARMFAGELSAIDRFWMTVGYPVSGQELDTAMRSHRAALVRLGFLDQASLPASMVSACLDTQKTLDDLRCKCPWYYTETLSGTNLVLTACSEMMPEWRRRAKELGW